MFKITKAESRSALEPALFAGEDDLRVLLSRFCASEEWCGDLSTGLLKIGSTAAYLHRLENRTCGLLDLVRGYEASDRNGVVQLFEQAATISSSFCFSTSVLVENGDSQPVFCIGQSAGLENRYSGTLHGVFFFPHFQTTSKPRFDMITQ